jgi:hypothetical protein
MRKLALSILAGAGLVCCIAAYEPQAVFRPSGTTHSTGVVPDPGGTAGTTRFLREDATWIAPVATNALYAPSIVKFTTTSTTTTYTLTPTSYYTILLVNVTSNAATITLPPIASYPGYIVFIKKVDTSGNAINMKASSGTESVEGATTSYSQASSSRIAFTLTNDGSTNWWVN